METKLIANAALISAGLAFLSLIVNVILIAISRRQKHH